MKIAIIFPDSDQKCSVPVPTCNLGIAYIASFLKKHGHHVDLYDCPPMQIKMSQLLKILTENYYDAIGLSAYTENYIHVLRVANYIKSLSRNIFIFVGGYLPSLAHNKMINDLNIFDCLVLGDGELTTLHLIENLKNNQWKNTKGIVYKEGDHIIETGEGMCIENIDDIPFPMRVRTKNDEINIMTSRGCSRKCSFCSIGTYYRKYHCAKVMKRSPENVIDEIKNIIQETDAKTLIICDDNFMFSSKGSNWFEEFLNLLNKNQIRLKYNMQIRADQIENNLDNIIKFSEYGLSWIFIGIESFLQKHLDYYNKGTTVNDNLKAIKLLEDTNLNVRIGYMLFNPIITLNDILETISFIRENNINRNKLVYYGFISNSHLDVYPGTPIAEDTKARKCDSNNSRGYTIADKKSELCFNVMEIWNIKMQNIFNVNSINLEIFNFKKLMSSLFYLDLDFLENVTEALLRDDNYKSINDFEDIIKHYIKRGYEIMDKSKL